MTCQCGWRTRGPREVVVPAVQEHGRSAHGVVRYLVAHDIDLPDRARHGPAKGEITWRSPTLVGSAAGAG